MTRTKEIVRKIPEEAWDVYVWPSEDSGPAKGTIDVADRQRIVAAILAATGTPRPLMFKVGEGIGLVLLLLASWLVVMVIAASMGVLWRAAFG